MNIEWNYRTGNSGWWRIMIMALLALNLAACDSSKNQGRDPGTEIAPSGEAAEDASGGSPFAVMLVTGEGAVGQLKLPLKKTSIRAQVTDSFAVTDISQVYHNDTGKKIEVLYQFPLPYQGAVTDMIFRVNNRTVVGTIKEREEARREYEQARAAGQTASLVEQERPNIFSQSIANILPDDDIAVTLRIYHPLRFNGGSFEYAFPITIGPRYMGGEPIGRSGEGWSPDTSQTPDASRISPRYIPRGVDSSHLLDLEITLTTQIKIDSISSPSHYVLVQSPSDGQHIITLSPRDRIPNKDFILRYKTVSHQPQFSLLTHRLPGEEGFFSITLVPPSERREAKVVPKEMIFVLDRSGSMEGVTMEKAKEALVKALRRLNDGDAFNVILFDDAVERLWERPRAVDAVNVQAAVRYTEAVAARGGTEMEAPLLEALGYPDEPSRQRIVLFITDGNVGYEQRLLGMIRQNLGRARIFSVGIGSSVNRYLVGEVAREGRGIAEFIRQDEDVAERLDLIYRRISSPILTNVDFDFDGLEVADIYPERARDLFAEEPTTLVGRYHTTGQGTLRVKAHAADGDVDWEFPLDLPAEQSANPALRYAWAKQKIDSLALTALGEETPELKEEIIELSRRYSVLSKYTAFIAVEREIRDPDQWPAERWLIPSELPEGLRFNGLGPEVQLKVSRVRPGDPVIFVDAPQDAQAVVAMMPFGEALKLVYEPELGRYSARFLVPYGTADGSYPFTVIVTHRDGTTKHLAASYVVDSQGPDLTVRAILQGDELVIEAVPEANVFIGEGVEVWPDVKEVIAILPYGREVKLNLDPAKKSRWIWRWSGQFAMTDNTLRSITLRAVDYAGNWREKRIDVELPGDR